MKNNLILRAKLPYLNIAERIAVKMILFLFGGLITVYNEEFLESLEDPVIFVFNHNSYFETILLGCYLIFKRKGKKLSFIIDWMFRYLPIAGWLINKTNPVYVYNKPSTIFLLNKFFKPEKNKKVYEDCSNLISDRISLGIFPEGTINRDPEFLKRGKSGAAKIVLDTNVCVVPIGIDFPKKENLKKIPAFGPVIFRIGKKMNFSEYHKIATFLKNSGKPEQERKLTEMKIRNTITHKIMNEISRLSGKIYPFEPDNSVTESLIPE